MAKVNLFIEYCLRKEKIEYNIKGIYKDNKIKYKDDKSIIVINLNNNILEKYQNENKIVFDFNNQKCYLDNYNIDLNIDVIKIINDENIFYVHYKIENDSFEIKIKIK